MPADGIRLRWQPEHAHGTQQTSGVLHQVGGLDGLFVQLLAGFASAFLNLLGAAETFITDIRLRRGAGCDLLEGGHHVGNCFVSSLHLIASLLRQ